MRHIIIIKTYWHPLELVAILYLPNMELLLQESWFFHMSVYLPNTFSIKEKRVHDVPKEVYSHKNSSIAPVKREKTVNKSEKLNEPRLEMMAQKSRRKKRQIILGDGWLPMIINYRCPNDLPIIGDRSCHRVQLQSAQNLCLLTPSPL